MAILFDELEKKIEVILPFFITNPLFLVAKAKACLCQLILSLSADCLWIDFFFEQTPTL